MLEKVLLNLAEDELLSFLPKETVSFIMSLTSGVEEDRGLYKTRLASLVAASYGAEFIFNEKLRNRLIESLKPSSFIKVFYSNEDVQESSIRPRHYDVIVNWAKDNLQSFAALLDMSDEYNAVINASTSIESLAPITPAYPLYSYQARISKEVLTNYAGGKTRQLIHLPTGAGKTRTAINIVSEHLRESPSNLVLWLADREELCTQAFEEFKSAWAVLGNRRTTAYGFYSDSSESLGGIDDGFIVAGLQKFISVRNSDSAQAKLLYRELLKKVTLVVFDEAHKAVAPEFRKVIEDFTETEGFKALLLGLTATPGRNFSSEGMTDEDKVLSEFFHGNKVSMSITGYLSPIDYLVEQKYLAKADFKSLNYDQSGILAYELVDSGGSQTLKALANNAERNNRILETIRNECEQSSSIIVFACTVQHARGLAAALSLVGIKAASVDGGDSINSRRMKIQQYKQGKLQVLTNYDVLTAGFDAPVTNVAVIARPMNSLVQYLQMIGRAMRGKRSGGNTICRIYTVMDEIPQFQSVNIGFSHWNEMWREKNE